MGCSKLNCRKRRFLLEFRFLLPFLAAVLGCTASVIGEDAPDRARYQAGPLLHDFQLTHEQGWRREVLGPLYYQAQAGSKAVTAFPPFYSHTRDPELEYTEIDVLYPLVTYDRFGQESRVQLLQLLSLSDSSEQDESVRHKLSLFPVYFQQRSTNAELNYTALFPFYGTLKNRMLRNEIQFTMFPLYGMSRKRDVVTQNYLYPFFHLREGNRLRGWQVWPLVGREVREPHSITNYLGLEQFMPGHRQEFALWPFMFRNHNDIGTTNEVRETAVLPFFSHSRSPNRDSSVYLWPFFKYTDDRENKYREWGFPWPLWSIARGEGKQMNRFWPLFSRAHNDDGVERNFYLWPLWKDEYARADSLDRRRSRLLFFLWSDLRERNPQTGKEMHRQDLWPLYTYRKQLDGRERLQLLSPLAPLLPNNKSVERNWSPVWALWRTEKNPAAQLRTDSLFWNLWRREISPEGTNNSYFFGLAQSRKTTDGTRWKWFHFSRGNGGKNAEAEAGARPSDSATRLQPELDPIRLRPVTVDKS